VRQGGVWGDGVPRSVPNVAKVAWVPSRAPLPVRLLKVYVGIGPLFRCYRSVSNAGCHLRLRHLHCICVYVFGICVVATILFVTVDDLEPNRRYASVLKFLIVFASVAAIAGRLLRSSADGLSALMP
jgi:hypothetical protein